MTRRTFAPLVSAAALALSLTGAVTAAVCLPGAAYAQTAQSKAIVDAAKAAGAVGEQSDGFLGFVTASSDAALRAAVSEINAGRAQVYREAAAKSGASAEAAGASAFTNVISARLTPGQFYKNTAGVWVRK